MKSRTITTIIFAAILVILVMLVAAGATFIRWVDETKIETRTDAQFSYGGAQNMKIMVRWNLFNSSAGVNSSISIVNVKARVA